MNTMITQTIWLWVFHDNPTMYLVICVAYSLVYSELLSREYLM